MHTNRLPTLRRNDDDQSPTVAAAMLLCGILGSFIFTLAWLVEGMTRSAYNAWQQPISALSLGPGGWVQSASFLTFGALLGCSARGWRMVLRPGRGSIAIPLLKGLTALGLIVDGIFVQDPANGYPRGSVAPAIPSLHGTIHLAGAVVAITALALTCFVFSWRFARDAHWHAWAVGAAVSGVLTFAFIIAFGSATQSGPAGLYERLATTIQGVFTLLLVGRILLAGRGALSPGVMRAASTGDIDSKLPVLTCPGAAPMRPDRASL